MSTPFIVGIDLGTTNCAVAYVEAKRDGRVELFTIPQLTAPSTIEGRSVLPSFLYFPEQHEIESGALALPWNRSPDAIAGVLARDRGALAPARQVVSAKSWLAHPAVDRHAAILPWVEAAERRISPVDASTSYLAHIRDAWNTTVGGDDEQRRLERQRIVLTVPASFDEVARELTVEAARAARFDQLTLIEEPIAAFYAWMAEDRSQVSTLEDGRLALVCDVGGGTTDFSLIRVHVEGGMPRFERVAIGEHLLLGGDNVDFALAALVERRISEARPDARLAITQRAALRRACSAAKERMLDDAPPDRVAVTVLGTGRALVGGAFSVELTREDVQQTVDDFLPISGPGQIAIARDRRGGLRELGLPYETDPAITRHLAAFLSRAAPTIADARTETTVAGRIMVRPDLVLFNGGFFTPGVARDRIVEALALWFGGAPRVLTTSSLESAVAVGAATYGRLRAGIGPAVGFVTAGSARAYYVGLRAPRIDEATTAVCVLARGTEEGSEKRLEHPFTVVTNRPISFALYSSMVRSDQVGDVVSLRPDDDAHQHAPLVTVLRYGRKSRAIELPVRLSIAFTEVGTLELWCESQTTEHRWRLQFQIRGADDRPQPGSLQSEAVLDDEAVAAGERAIRSVFDGPSGDLTAENLVAFLEQTTGYAKTAWPLPAIRRFADVLIEVAGGRKRSAALEARWLNLFGFCLRPGFGAAKDPWRVTEARKVYAAGIAFPNATQNRVEWLVLWQRVASGFTAGQQRDLAQRLMGELGIGVKKAAHLNPQIERESWRLLASLERLDGGTRVRIGDVLLSRVRREPDNASLSFSIGRLGARAPLYGPLSSVVPPAAASRWIDHMIPTKRLTPDLAAALVQIGARTGDPLRDVDDSTRERLAEHLRKSGVDADASRALDEVTTSNIDANKVFGEPLPDGLQLESPQS